MLRYLKEAFWLRIDVRGLGRLPVNALAAAGVAILGFAEPAVWLLGLGLEAGYLTMMATHPRFQRAIDARAKHAKEGAAELDAAARRRELVAELGPEARQRLETVETRASRILQIWADAEADDYVIESNREALARLSWIYLKLLVARHYLQSSEIEASEQDLERRIAALARELEFPDLTQALRASRAATLEILRQRLANLERREQSVAEIESDLARIEAQVDLTLENATMSGSGRGALVPANIELASRLLEDGLYFGEAETAVAALDHAYAMPPPAPVKTR